MSSSAESTPGGKRERAAAPTAGFPAAEPARRRRSLKDLAAGLAPPQAGPPRTAGTKPASAAEIVNGLDQRELRYGAILAALDLALTLVVFLYWRHSHTLKVRQYAPDFLIAGLIGVALLAGGLFFRRRALLGFAAFLVGMEMISFGLIYGIIFLFFGGWLLMRVMRKQKQDRTATQYVDAVTTRAKPRPAGPPGASKRYTPPRRAAGRRGAATRRR